VPAKWKRLERELNRLSSLLAAGTATSVAGLPIGVEDTIVVPIAAVQA